MIFVNWNTLADGNGIPYDTGANLTVTANVTLYAQWVAKPRYLIKYDGNGNDSGDVPNDPHSYTAGSSITVLDNTGLLAKPDSTFDGWTHTGVFDAKVYNPVIH
jgi:hypothetical protein